MCKHNRVLRVSAKCSDMCCVTFERTGYTKPVEPIDYDGYVPEGIGITDGDGFGDYVGFTLCVECGKIVTPGVTFPIPDAKITKGISK